MQQDEIRDEIIISGPQLSRAFRRQLRLWVWLFLPLLGLLLLLALCLVPRSYTSSVSISIQQPSGGSTLALLAGGSAPSKRYIGVLKSRDLAAFVESRVHLRDLYGVKQFPTEADAAQMLMKAVKPEDNATDGLLYVAVTLPGPPKLSLSHSPSQPQIEDAAARAANAYALALQHYYVASDTDQGLALLRQADQEVRQDRRNYSQALARVNDFNQSLSRVDPRSAPSASTASDTANPTGAFTGDAAAAVAGMSALYGQLYQVQTELRASEAIRRSGDALTAAQLRSLSSVPGDDPLLITIRSQVKQDQAAYNTYSSLYGPENPNVINARKRLTVDQLELNRQVQGVKNRLTTSSIRSDQQISGLYARQKNLLLQIAQAERRLGTHRQLSGELGRLETEVAIELEVLRTSMVEAKKIKMNNASALSRMSVVDDALPAKSGEPGVAKLATACLALLLLVFAGAVVREYLRLVEAERAAPALLEHAANGTGPVSLDEPAVSGNYPPARRR